jgi:outer membrane protein assembly factor BamD
MKILRHVSILHLLRTIFLPVALVSGLALTTGCSSAEKHDSSTAEGAFRQAEDYEKDERFEEAIAKFNEVRNKHPYSRFAPEAELRIADVHFKREAFIEAAGAYQLFREFRPRHPRSDYVTFRLGLSYFNQLPKTIDRDLSVADKAILYFEEVINSYPKSEHVAEATAKRTETLRMLAEKEMYVANFYSKRNNHDSALKRYESLLKRYPNQGFDAQALYGAAKSAYESGEKDRGRQHLRNLYSLYPNSEEAKRARNEFEKLGSN